MAINTFGDKNTEVFFLEGRVRKGAGWSAVRKIALRKLDMIHYAGKLEDLKSSPGNRLERLRGKLAGYHSIRINDQWRIVFRWTSAGPEDVRICDYH